MQEKTHEKYFEKEVDMNSKESIAEFLSSHFRYYTANSWNHMTSYAQNVKVYNLHLPKDAGDRAYDIALAQFDGDEKNPYQEEILKVFTQFRLKTGYMPCFNGKTDGYLVLLKTDDSSILAKGIDENMSKEDYMELDFTELKDRAELVMAFDKCCDEIRDLLIYYSRNYKVKTENQIFIEKRPVRVMVPVEEIVDETTERLKPGDNVVHFKHEMDKPENGLNYMYTIIGFGLHTETNERQVIYQKSQTGEIFIRPYDMFMEEVDKEKYPFIKQKYRLEKITTN